MRQKDELAGILGVPPTDVRVECGDVGGNFGTRNAFYPGVRAGGVGGEAPRPPGEMDLRALGGLRSATTRAATRRSRPELALDDSGRFLALRGSVICNIGAHSVMYVPLVKCSSC